jgi:hypothetical protein
LGKEEQMKIYKAKIEEDIVDSLIKMMEQDTGKKVFTIRVIGETDDGLETLVVFTDETILMSKITIMTLKGNYAFRMQGNYI